MHPESGRVGLFFLFIGLILLILFSGSGSVSGENTQVGYFFLSLLSFILAFFLIRKDWKTPGQSARFRAFRKLTQKKPTGKGPPGKK
jgi:hypothetical protein